MPYFRIFQFERVGAAGRIALPGLRSGLVQIFLFFNLCVIFPLRERGMWIKSPASQDKAVRLRCPSGYWVFPAGMIGRAASFLPGSANGELI